MSFNAILFLAMRESTSSMTRSVGRTSEYSCALEMKTRFPHSSALAAVSSVIFDAFKVEYSGPNDGAPRYV